MNPTNNSLREFDICLALAQLGLNSQLEDAWDKWKTRNSIVSRINIRLPQEDGKEGLSAEFQAPQIDLNLKAAKPGEVRVILTLDAGTIDFLDAERQVQHQKFDDCRVSFRVGLGKQRIKLDHLKELDKVSGEQIATLIQESDLDNNAFSIEYLFMRFTNLDWMVPGSVTYEGLDDLPDLARLTALAALKRLLETKVGNTLVMGMVVYPGEEKTQPPTFGLADFLLNISRHEHRPNASTLDYLGVFSGRKLPERNGEAVARLNDVWVAATKVEGQTDSVHGAMFLRGDKLTHYFGEQIVAKISKGLAPHNPTVKKTPRDKGYCIATEFRHGKHDVKWTLDIEALIGTPQYLIRGQFVTSINISAVVGLATASGDATQTFAGTISLLSQSAGIGFALKLAKPKIEYSDVFSSAKTGGVVGVLDNFIGKFDASISHKKIIEQITRAVAHVVNNILSNELDNIEISVDDCAFVPPGARVFNFQNPLFTNHGDVALDVIWKKI